MKLLLAACYIVLATGCSAKEEKVTIHNLASDKPDSSVTEVIEERISE